MADWFESPLRTCSHVCDFPTINNHSEQELFCCDGLGGKFKDARKVLLVSCAVSFTGSFYGNDRNVRGQIQLMMEQEDGVLRPIGFIPIGGYLYHNDYGYYQGEKTFNLNLESQYILAKDDYMERFVIKIVNDKGLDSNCDVKIYICHSMRIKL
uniref:Putative nuclear shuttle protein n=1 Tax=Sophora yellow stunt virus TaxID=1980160 RepID=A0A4D6PE89_9VIRU|nr:nuclear shuttle protein [Sophora yellow stunt virus]